MEIRRQKINNAYVPEQASEEDLEQFDNVQYEPTEEEKKLIDLHEELKSVYGNECITLSQLEAFKNKYENIHISKVGSDSKNYYIWRTLRRYEYKEMMKGKVNEDMEALNEMVVEKCILFPLYDFQFRNQSDAGVITTLGQQIQYKSGFVSPQEALSLIYVA